MDRKITMYFYKYFVGLLLTFFSLSSCNYNDSENAGYAYFGGEIINPKSDVVVVVNKENEILDTLKLDNNNRFNYKIEFTKPSVYKFFHGGEYQLVILEPKDSIMFRLNTYDFDESLVFTGEGSKKNNFLLKTFIENENQRKKLVKYSQKDPEAFDIFITAKHKVDLDEFHEFIKKKPISEFSKHIIESNINYHYYANKEIYPFAYFGNNKLVHVRDLPENFYQYRTQIDYNDRSLDEIYAYNRFLFSHFDNLALKDYYNKEAYHSAFNRHEIKYNLAKLDLIDSLITEETIKNNLLKYKTRDFINHTEIDNEINEVLNYFIAKSTSKEDVTYIKNQVESIKKLRPGQGLPDLKILNVNDQLTTISEAVNRPTLLYFWSSNNIQHYRNSHYRVRELREKFPEMAFMSINTNDYSEVYWKETLNKYKFSLSEEFRFKNPKKALKTLAINYVYKVIIVDKNANIVLPNVNIFNDDFELLLKDLKLKKELSI